MSSTALDHLRETTRRAAGFALALSLAGCSAAPSRTVETPATQPTSQENLDQLRSLPYVSFATEEADKHRSGVVARVDGLSYPGYTLYSNHALCSANLIDNRGRVINSWSFAPCHDWANAELVANGDLLVSGVGATTDDDAELALDRRFLLRLSWKGDVVWIQKIPSHHDVEITPAGRILTLTMSRGRDPRFSDSFEVRDNQLALLEPDGTAIESVSLLDVLSASEPGFTLNPVAPNDRTRDIDILHANSIEWMHHSGLRGTHPIYASDNILITMRNQDAVAVVDWRTRRLVWSWGRGELLGPHAATWLEDGHILVFDNGLGRDWSRVVEIDPITEKIVWEYRAPTPGDFYSPTRGSAQRLPNGNTLICEADKGHGFEVTPDGKIVWEFFNPETGHKGRRATLVRMKRYELAEVDAIRRRNVSSTSR